MDEKDNRRVVACICGSYVIRLLPGIWGSGRNLRYDAECCTCGKRMQIYAYEERVLPLPQPPSAQTSQESAAPIIPFRLQTLYDAAPLGPTPRLIPNMLKDMPE